MDNISVHEIDGVWFAVTFGDDERIVASTFSNGGRKEVITSILKKLPAGSSFSEVKPKGESLDVLRNIHRIYEGKPGKREFRLDMDRLSQFVKKVLLVTYQIPRGSVMTYGGIAKAVGDTGAARAVGQAEAKNPFPLIVPCHRVINSNFGLHGYGGGLDVKRAILEREGVTFVGDRVSKENLWVPEE